LEETVSRRIIDFAKITRAKQLRLANTGDFHADLLRAIDPTNKVKRYGRTWRFSKPAGGDREFILGKLGFTHEGEEARTDYDEDAQDFITAVAPARQTFFSHFVADSGTEVIAFEERGRLIRRKSFLAAFEGLLVEADFEATVDVLTDPAALQEWAKTVDRVVSLRAFVKNPNPGWVRDAGAIRQFVEETDAATAAVTVKAAEGAGINVTAPWVGGALQQISEEGQGSMSAIGIRQDGHEDRWTNGQRPRTDSLEEDPTDDSDTIWQRLIGRLRANFHDL
jgi:hypothetical protein